MSPAASTVAMTASLPNQARSVRKNPPGGQTSPAQRHYREFDVWLQPRARLPRKVQPDGRLRRDRRRLPCHHLPAFRPFSPHVGVAAVEQLGLALDDGVYPDLAGHDNGVVAVDLHVLDRALELAILEYALL